MGTNRQMRRWLYTLKKTKKKKHYFDYNGVLHVICVIPVVLAMKMYLAKKLQH